MTLLPKTPSAWESLETWDSFRRQLAAIKDDDPVRLAEIRHADHMIDVIRREAAALA